MKSKSKITNVFVGSLVSIALFLIQVTVSFAQTVSFSAPTNFTAGTGPTSVAVGDFNGDGSPDLAVTNNGSSNVSILLGTGTGSFGAATSFAFGTDPISVAVGDFDGDGRLDLAVANLNSNNVSILLNTTTITVAIDIKPGSDPNSINPRSKGVIPVAILTTDTFDASTVDPTTVQFGPNGAAPVHAVLEDVDGDGDLDLILHFKTQETGIACGDTQAVLTGQTFGGQAIEGSDAVNTVGC